MGVPPSLTCKIDDTKTQLNDIAHHFYTQTSFENSKHIVKPDKLEQLVLIQCTNSEKLVACKGQLIKLAISSLRITIAAIKDRLSEIISLSPSKQKLTLNRFGSLEDDNSLADYDYDSYSIIHLDT